MTRMNSGGMARAAGVSPFDPTTITLVTRDAETASMSARARSRRNVRSLASAAPAERDARSRIGLTQPFLRTPRVSGGASATGKLIARRNKFMRGALACAHVEPDKQSDDEKKQEHQDERVQRVARERKESSACSASTRSNGLT